jgi:hypothetical protein
MIGNAVPPLLGIGIGRLVLPYLTSGVSALETGAPQLDELGLAA